MALPQNLVRQLLVCALLSIMFYAAWAAYGGMGDVWAAAKLLGSEGWAIILSLSLVNYLLRFSRWDYYLRQLGYKVPTAANISAYLAGFGLTMTPGKVGEAVRSVYLKRLNVRYVHSLSAFFVERFIDLISMIIVASLAAYAFEGMRWLVAVTFVLVVALLPLIRSQGLYGWLDRLRQGLRSARLRSMGEHLLNMLSSSVVLLRSGPLYAGLTIGLLAWAAEGYALYVVLDRIGAETPLALAAGIYGVSILAGVVSFIPGGLGGTELVMGSLLILSGVDAPLAVSAVIICRLATLWFAVVIGLAFLVGIEFREQGNIATGELNGDSD